MVDNTGSTEKTSESSRCGYVAIVGRPNVGKSTLLNHLIGQKLSITSRKPQTTRHNLLGIKTTGSTQIIYVDTPGQHDGQTKAINRYMNRAALSAMLDVDVVVFVIDKNTWTAEDEAIVDRLRESNSALIVVINKMDQVRDRQELLPHIQTLADKLPKAEVVPVSALQKKNLDLLEKLIVERLPGSEHFFSEDQITDKSVRFLVAEIVREKITRQLGDELPYQAAVEIESFEERENHTFISAVIYVERKGQKQILIGSQGARIKLIGESARKEIESLVERKVMLKLWVKVKSGWSDDDRALRSLGYDEK